jgi:hypothetical protein
MLINEVPLKFLQFLTLLVFHFSQQTHPPGLGLKKNAVSWGRCSFARKTSSELTQNYHPEIRVWAAQSPVGKTEAKIKIT